MKLRHKTVSKIIRLLLLLTFNIIIILALYWFQLLPADKNASTPEPRIYPTVEYRPVITVENIDAKRFEIIQFIWGEALPDILPTEDGDTLQITHRGIQTQVQVYRPVAPNGSAIILHAGHEGSSHGYYTRTRERFVEAGYMVIVMEMPFTGQNQSYSMIALAAIGTVPVYNHDQLMFVEDPLQIFLDPVIAVVNWLSPQFEHIYMVGLSGGGWTTVLSAAVDTRIDASYPIAGSIPLGLQVGVWESGATDFEQNIPSFFQHTATYEDLYLLGAFQRRQVQIFNEFDPCCFAYHSGVETYERAIVEHLNGDGAFSVFIDADQNQHIISDAVVDFILNDITSLSRTTEN